MTLKDRELRALVEFYHETSTTFAEAQRASGMHCPSDCGACCTAPTVSATVFEMLPMAIALYHEGRAEAVFDQIQNSPEGLCPVFQGHPEDPKKGRCGSYATRPLVCRVFAVASRCNKHGDAELVVCKELKQLYPELAQDFLGQAHQLPSVNLAYSKMTTIDPAALEKPLHIRQALGVALDKVLYHFARKSAQGAEINK